MALPVWAQAAGLLILSNVFMTFACAVFYMHEPVKLDYLWAGLWAPPICRLFHVPRTLTAGRRVCTGRLSVLAF